MLAVISAKRNRIEKQRKLGWGGGGGSEKRPRKVMLTRNQKKLREAGFRSEKEQISLTVVRKKYGPQIG